MLSVLLVACYMIWRYCLTLVWSFLVHCTCLLLPNWMWVVSSQVHLVWVLHFLFLLLQPQPWPVFCSCCFSHCLCYCFISICLFTCHYMYKYSFCLCLTIWNFYFWHHVVFLALVKITLVDAYMHIYAIAWIKEWVCIYMCTWLYIQWNCTLVDYMHDCLYDTGCTRYVCPVYQYMHNNLLSHGCLQSLLATQGQKEWTCNKDKLLK